MNRAQSPADEAGSLVLTRRDLFTPLGSAVVLVACGGKSHTASPITASTGAPASRATGSGSAGSTAPPVASGGNNSTSGNLVQIGGPHATAPMRCRWPMRSARRRSPTGTGSDRRQLQRVEPSVRRGHHRSRRQHKCFGYRARDFRPAHDRSRRCQRHHGGQACRRRVHGALHRRSQRQRNNGLDADGAGGRPRPHSAMPGHQQRLTLPAVRMPPACSMERR